jgi:hypothetical protein
MAKKKKSPYPGYSLREVSKMENAFFVIRFGGDFLFHDGHHVFTRTEADKLYYATLGDLLDVVEDGNEKDRRYALDLLGTTSIQPMRLH